MLAFKNVMLICFRRQSRAFLTDILQAKATVIMILKPTPEFRFEFHILNIGSGDRFANGIAYLTAD